MRKKAIGITLFALISCSKNTSLNASKVDNKYALISDNAANDGVGDVEEYDTILFPEIVRLSDREVLLSLDSKIELDNVELYSVVVCNYEVRSKLDVNVETIDAGRSTIEISTSPEWLSCNEPAGIILEIIGEKDGQKFRSDVALTMFSYGGILMRNAEAFGI